MLLTCEDRLLGCQRNAEDNLTLNPPKKTRARETINPAFHFYILLQYFKFTIGSMEANKQNQDEFRETALTVSCLTELVHVFVVRKIDLFFAPLVLQMVAPVAHFSHGLL